MLELWHEWNSVHSFKVRVVLAEKELPWTAHRVELLKFEHLRPEYLKLNPNGAVPTLVHEGRTIVESSVICQYLDECFPQRPLLPADPYARARARLWLKYFDEVVHPAIRAASFELLYRPLLAALPRAELEARLAKHPNPSRARAFHDAGRDDAAVAGALEVFKTIVARIDQTLDGLPWLGGASFGLGDAALAAFAERLAHLRMDGLWAAWPRARRWRSALLSRPAVREAAAPEEFRFPAPAEPPERKK